MTQRAALSVSFYSASFFCYAVAFSLLLSFFGGVMVGVWVLFVCCVLIEKKTLS